MKKGISLISLIVTIIVIIILASITIYTSYSTIDEAGELKLTSELNDVANMVNEIRAKYEAGLLDINVTSATFVSSSQLANYLVEGEDTEFTAADKTAIENYNSTRTSNPKYGYHYITSSQINDDAIPGLENLESRYNVSVPKDVTRAYIINFAYGTVISTVATDKTLVKGTIK